jgi:ABC-2 type transport system ATP-binding protein
LSAAPLAIRANALTRRFGKVLAVDQLSLAIPRSHIYGFLGPNGSGKSTTLRMLCGLLRPDSGSIEALGLEIPRQAEALRQRLGYMTQKFALWEDLTTLENLHFMARIYGLDSALREQRVQQALSEYHLREFAARTAGTLSGGQKQRLALAAATLHRPELLLLDEPTSAVDPQSRRDFWDALFQLTASGTTILVSTHYMDEAERCHALAILDAGRVVAEGAPAELQRSCPLKVIEVQAADVAAARAALQSMPAVVSVAQLGTRLHALLDLGGAGDVAAGAAAQQQVMALLAARQLPAEVRLVTASLEDVFVAATQPAAARAA